MRILPKSLYDCTRYLEYFSASSLICLFSKSSSLPRNFSYSFSMSVPTNRSLLSVSFFLRPSRSIASKPKSLSAISVGIFKSLTFNVRSYASKYSWNFFFIFSFSNVILSSPILTLNSLMAVDSAFSAFFPSFIAKGSRLLSMAMIPCGVVKSAFDKSAFPPIVSEYVFEYDSRTFCFDVALSCVLLSSTYFWLSSFIRLIMLLRYFSCLPTPVFLSLRLIPNKFAVSR